MKPIPKKIGKKMTHFFDNPSTPLLLSLIFCLLMTSHGNMAHAVIEVELPSSPNIVGSGARALGMGGAFISIADDATAASWNPAGLIQLEKPEMSAVFNYTHRREEHSVQEWDPSEKQDINSRNLNYLSASYPFRFFRRNMIVSLSYQHLYEFDRNLDAVYHTLLPTYQEMTSVAYRQEGDLYAVGFSYCAQLTERFSVGFTINYWGDFINDNQWNQTYKQKESSVYLKNSEKGIEESTDIVRHEHYDFNGMNANFGVMWWISDKFRISGVLKTGFSADVEYAMTMTTDTSTQETNQQTTRTSEDTLHMPLQYGIGTAYRFSDRFEIAFDLYKTHWNDFEYESENGIKISPISGKDIRESHIDATIWCRLGMEYLVMKEKYIVPVRAGLFYDPGPSEKGKDEYFGFSLGTGLIFKKYVMDIAYQYRFGNDVGESFLEHLGFSQDVREHKIYSSVILYF